MTLEVLLCYAKEDEAYMRALEVHLSVLHEQGFFGVWHRGEIRAGAKWAREISTHLNTAQIIILLISQYFLASNQLHSAEIEQAMKRHEQGKAQIIPVILRPVYYGRCWFAELQCLPTDNKPIRIWRNRDAAFFDVAESIRKAAEKLLVALHSPEKE